MILIHVLKKKNASWVDDEGEGVTYEIKIPGTSKRKFENLFKLARLVLCIVHSNAEEESLFSPVRKNLMPQEHHFL